MSCFCAEAELEHTITKLERSLATLRDDDKESKVRYVEVRGA